MYYWIFGTIVLIYVVFVGYSVYSHASLSPALIARAHVYEQHPEKSQHSTSYLSIRILVAGDSGAVGVGAVDSKNSVAGRIGADFPNADITNISVSGARLDDLKKVLEKALEKNSEKFLGNYDLLVLQIGANDVTHLTSSADVTKTLDTVLGLGQKIAKNTLILTSGDVGAAPLFYFPLNTIYNIRTKQVRDIFMKEISKYKNTYYADLFKEGKANILNTDIPRYYAADHFHPSDDGYGVWYQSVQPVLFDILK